MPAGLAGESDAKQAAVQLLTDARNAIRGNRMITDVCIHRSSNFSVDIEHELAEEITNAGLKSIAYANYVDSHSVQPTLHIVPTFDGELLSNSLLNFVERDDLVILAPITKRHVSQIPIISLSVPKAGTHLMLKLLEEFGIKNSFASGFEPGRWSFLNKANAHSPIEQVFSAFRWPEDCRTHPFFRSAGVFIYRHPLDIVLSESAWFRRPEVSPFSFFFGPMDDRTRIDALINGPLGTISGRVLCYWGWLSCPNIACISYEELVGEKGGGSRDIQLLSIWALQLKLHVSGSPDEYAGRIYDELSPTFDTGRIGRYREVLDSAQIKDAERMNQNSRFLDKFGYALDGDLFPSIAPTQRRRGLVLA